MAKYHTSKLREFSDVEEIATFGFRGEALSSLCALSNMTVITKHHSVDVATRIEYNQRGEVTKKSACARQTGTSVILTDLFGSLPVRKREFHKNIKKEFTKVCEIIQAYGLISYGKRIFLTNQLAKGSKTTVISTNGSFSMYDNILSIFGSKQGTQLLEIKQPVQSNEVLTQDVIKNLDATVSFTAEEIENLGLDRFVFDGYVSNCTHGYGRATRDRQFFFINGRPCDPKALIKVVNDTYHKFNVHQCPFIALNIMLDRKDVDVNLTPDKRNLLVNNEAILKLALKKSLYSTFTPLTTTFKMQNTTLTSFFEKADYAASSSTEKPDAIDGSDENQSDNKVRSPMMSLLQKSMNAKQSLLGGVAVKRKSEALDDIAARTHKLKKIQHYLQQDIERDKKAHLSESDSDSTDDGTKTPLKANREKLYDFKRSAQSNDEKSPTSDDNQPIKNYRIDCKVKEQTPGVLKTEPRASSTVVERITIAPSMGKKLIYDGPADEQTDQKHHIKCNPLHRQQSIENAVKVCVTMPEIETLMRNELRSKIEYDQAMQTNKMKFKAKIEPSKNKAAEAELETSILQEDFQRMEIIGQFNLGFIICRLDNDLFIVDQHATDEKYNFETLQKTTRLQHQPLVVPQSLGLSAVNENILLSHLEMFEMNGFRFHIDMDQPTTQRIRLTAKPHSQNWDFGKDVIDELIFMIHEDSENSMSIDMCRPSKIRAMFASRACRKSVMIGTSLAKSDMRRLIDHMGLIEQPWVSGFS